MRVLFIFSMLFSFASWGQVATNFYMNDVDYLDVRDPDPKARVEGQGVTFKYNRLKKEMEVIFLKKNERTKEYEKSEIKKFKDAEVQFRSRVEHINMAARVILSMLITYTEEGKTKYKEVVIESKTLNSSDIPFRQIDHVIIPLDTVVGHVKQKRLDTFELTVKKNAPDFLNVEADYTISDEYKKLLSQFYSNEDDYKASMLPRVLDGNGNEVYPGAKRQ